jgi:UDP-glucose 4-epimerase
MRVLITGGFGFIGGRLAQFLALRLGHEVCLGSRRTSESPAWLPQAKTVQTQWHSAAALEQICSDVDAVVHLAAKNTNACAADPRAALEFNAGVTDRLLQAAVRQRVKRFVYLSTAHVYGSPLSGVITEQTPTVALHPYATSHRVAEESVVSAHLSGDIEGVVIRLSNAYGAPAHRDADCWMLLVNDLCRQLVITQQMLVHSTGLQRRDFVPMTDVCGAIGHLLAIPAHKLGRGLFNVGGAWAPTVWEMACLIGERCEAILDFPSQLSRTTTATGETCAGLDYRLDTLLQTGFQPSANKIEEIDRLIRFCKTSLC